VLRGTAGVRFPMSAPVARPFHRSLGFPWGGKHMIYEQGSGGIIPVMNLD